MLHRASARALAVAVLFVVALAAALAPPAGAAKAKPRLTSAKLQQLVTPKGINAHLKKLQRIASAYGDRFAGAPGHDASAQYVFDTLKAAGYKPTFDEFEYPAFSEVEPTTFANGDAPYDPETDFGVLEYSGAGDVTGAAVKVGGTGCTAADVPAASAPTDIAVIDRGACTFREKVNAATTQGYAGVVIVNNEPGPLNGTLGSEEGASQIPAIGVTTAVGDAIAAGDTLSIRTVTSTRVLKTRNVLAETKGGNARNTVVVGAHLDSVEGGPGINDNGSGSAAILEIARQIKKIGVAPRNKLRFAWWSAEESGLVGATDYVSRLTPEQQLDIALYLNFDMIGSPNFARFIYDGDNTLGTDVEAPPGSDAIEANFERFFAKRNLATEPTEFDGRSDYGPFIDVGIPAGGLFTGAEGIKTPEQAAKFGGTAGAPFDPNYHQPGDTFANVNQQALDEQSDAIADSVALYANDTSSVDDQDQDQGVQGFRAPKRPALPFQGPQAVR